MYIRHIMRIQIINYYLIYITLHVIDLNFEIELMMMIKLIYNNTQTMMTWLIMIKYMLLK